MVIGKDSRGKFITRLNTEALSSLVFKSPFAQRFIRQLPLLPHCFAYIDKLMAGCKREWNKFFNKYQVNMKVLSDKILERLARHRSSSVSQSVRDNPICSDLLQLVSHSTISEDLFYYITQELTNTNILASLAENCQVQLTIIQEDV